MTIIATDSKKNQTMTEQDYAITLALFAELLEKAKTASEKQQYIECCTWLEQHKDEYCSI